MTSVRGGRLLVRELLGGAGHVIAVPLALPVAGRIQERDPEEFVLDPTQLANALRDLVEALQPDGVPVTSPEVLLRDCTSASSVVSGYPVAVAIEATKRLRQSMGDLVALVAHIPGPSDLAEHCGADPQDAVDCVTVLGKSFVDAGADVVLVEDVEHEMSGVSLSTLRNIAQFHQAMVFSRAQGRYGLPYAAAVPLANPLPGKGFTVTEGELPRSSDIGVLRGWVLTVQGGRGQ